MLQVLYKCLYGNYSSFAEMSPTFYSGDWVPFKLPNRMNQINIKQPQTCSCGGQLWQTKSLRAEPINK